MENKTILRHGKARWLPFLPAVQRTTEVFPALKAYFLSHEKCPV
jgi:hypothetical protein